MVTMQHGYHATITFEFISYDLSHKGIKSLVTFTKGLDLFYNFVNSNVINITSVGYLQLYS